MDNGNNLTCHIYYKLDIYSTIHLYSKNRSDGEVNGTLKRKKYHKHNGKELLHE